MHVGYQRVVNKIAFFGIQKGLLQGQSRRMGGSCSKKPQPALSLMGKASLRKQYFPPKFKQASSYITHIQLSLDRGCVSQVTQFEIKWNYFSRVMGKGGHINRLQRKKPGILGKYLPMQQCVLIHNNSVHTVFRKRQK